MTTFSDSFRVAVVGAGMSGLACAKQLSAQGASVEVFEKSRGASGRMSTRRTSSGLAFDHGAQYFTAKHEGFRQLIADLVEQGIVAEWKGRICEIEQGVVKAKSSATTRYVGVPGMSAVGRALADGLTIRFETRVGSLEKHDQKWTLQDDHQRHLGEFDWVIVSAPAAQAAELTKSLPHLSSKASGVTMAACWALMIAFEKKLPFPFDGAFVNHSPISWIARNSSKPGRPSEFDTWVVHASPEWSDRSIEMTADEAGEVLYEEFLRQTGLPKQVPMYLQAHRWRYSLPTNPLSSAFLSDSEARLTMCGDWCNGSRVEARYLSGMAAAESVADCT